MSLTNDMKKLKDAADAIASTRDKDITTPVSMMENSFYEKRSESSNDITAILHPYDFTTPIELKAVLEDMWKEMGKEEMNVFLPVSMVAAAKNRPEDGKQKYQQQISAFVYEF